MEFKKIPAVSSETNSTSSQEGYSEPKKLITNNNLLKVFLEGKTIKLLNEFIHALQKSVEGKSRFDTSEKEVVILLNYRISNPLLNFSFI